MPAVRQIAPAYVPLLLKIAAAAVASRTHHDLALSTCQHVREALDALWVALGHRDIDRGLLVHVSEGGIRPGEVLLSDPAVLGALRVGEPQRFGGTEPHADLHVVALEDPEYRDAGVLVVAGPATENSGDGDGVAEFLRTASRLVTAAFERIRDHDELALSEQRLAEAQEMAHLGSYDWTIATNTNVWSDELYRIYGYEPDAFNASYEKFLSMVHPDDRDMVVAIHTKAMEDFQPYRMEERIVRPDGEVRVLDSSGKVVLDNAGRPVRMVGICLDVTDLRRAAERSAEAEQALTRAAEHRAQALEINDNVVQGLTAVVGTLELGRTDAALRGAQACLAAASGMMTKLLDGNPDELEPGDLVRDEHVPPHLVELGSMPTAAEAREPVSVLLADDSADLRQLYRLLLENRGFRVLADASDGHEAVRLALAHGPDVALIDLAMPGLDGLQTTAELKQRLPDCRVIIVSGFEEQRVGQQARTAGADHYLQKGVSADELAATILAVTRAPDARYDASA